MLPRLEAEETIAQANVVAFGTGSLKPHHSRAMARRWQAATRPAPAPTSPRSWIESFAQMGIPIIKVVKRG